MIFDASAFGTPVISNNKQKLTLVFRYMEYLTQVLVRMTPQKAVLSGLRSCPPVPTWVTSCRSCSDSIKILLLVFNYHSQAIGTTWGYADPLLNQYINQSSTNTKKEWASHLLTDWECDPALVLSRSKISPGLQGKTINPFLIVLSRGTGNLLHNPGWSIYIGSSTKATKVPWTNL